MDAIRPTANHATEMEPKFNAITNRDSTDITAVARRIVLSLSNAPLR